MTERELRPAKYYHVLNHANGHDLLFKNSNNYNYFLKQWRHYTDPVAETNCWCLLPSHFHFLIKVREEKEVLKRLCWHEVNKYLTTTYHEIQPQDSAPINSFPEHLYRILLQHPNFKPEMLNNQAFSERVSQLNNPIMLQKAIQKQFSNAFNSYAKAFNKANNRMGSLFMQNYKRKIIETEDYLRNVILYILSNPVLHGYCRNHEDWKYTSLHEHIDTLNTNPESKKVLQWFETPENLFFCLKEKVNLASDYTLE